MRTPTAPAGATAASGTHARPTTNSALTRGPTSTFASGAISARLPKAGSATGNVGYMMTKYLTLSNTDSTVKTIQNGNTYVNFRSAPSLTGSTVYDRLYTGTPITVLTPGDQWTQVRYNGRTGYVMTQFLK